MKKIINKDIIKNTIYAMGAQVITLLLSLIMSLVVPKILGIEEFGYWQLFLFYSNYVGFFHLGLTDGVYLKLGGKKYKEINSKLVSSQFFILFIMQLIFFVFIVFGQSFISMENDRRIVIISATIYMIIANLTWYIGYVFQAINYIKTYAVAVIIDRISFLLIVVIGVLIPGINSKFFIYAYIITKLISLIYLLIKSKDIISFRLLSFKNSLDEAIDSIKVGINLTISSVSSIFTLGIGRFIVDIKWGIEAFGKFSFALSLTNFFLTFINQISLVLFPSLRRIDNKQISNFYDIFRRILNIILPLVLILYIPLKYILILWVPQYLDSIKYLIILLPLCIFDGKMQLLSNTFLKVLRKERFLLIINIISMGISILLALISGLIVKNINLILISMVIAVTFRSVISEIYLAKILEKNIFYSIKSLILEIFIVIIFMIVSWNLSSFKAFVIMLLVYIVYIFINKESIEILTNKLKK